MTNDDDLASHEGVILVPDFQSFVIAGAAGVIRHSENKNNGCA